jgi:hypothetical protein
VKLLLDLGDGRIKESEGGGGSNCDEGDPTVMYLICCKNFSKCHNVPSPRKTILTKGFLAN